MAHLGGTVTDRTGGHGILRLALAIPAFVESAQAATEPVVAAGNVAAVTVGPFIVPIRRMAVSLIFRQPQGEMVSH